MKMVKILLCVSPLLMSACQPSGRSATATSRRYDGEATATFKARDVLPAARLRGPGYTIEDEVKVVDYDYLFKIKTAYGTIPAHSRNMLKLRLEEMKAIERAERLSKGSQVAKGVADSVKGTARGVELLVTDPVGSAKRAPTGMGRIVRSTVDVTEWRSGDQSRRDLAAKIGCDPETRNPVLKLFLDQMSVRQWVGGEVAGLIPYTEVFDLTADIEQRVRSNPPHVINDDIKKELVRLGVDRYVADKFIHNLYFTTTQRLIFMEAFRRLGDIGGRGSVAELAMESGSEAEALNAIDLARAYVDVHRSRGINGFEDIGLPMAVLRDGSHLIYCPADYLTATAEVREAVAAVKRVSPDARCEFMLSGKMTPEARQIFQGAGIGIKELG